jgi:hypothetical protein
MNTQEESSIIESESEALLQSFQKILKEIVEHYKSYPDSEDHLYWLAHFYGPAYEASISKEGTALHRVSKVCGFLNIWSGFTSDPRDFDIRPLYTVYDKANTFYQECWEKGYK